LRFFEHLLSKAGHCQSADGLHAEIALAFDGLADFPGWEFHPEAEWPAAQELARQFPDLLTLSVYAWNTYLAERKRRPRSYPKDYFQMKRLVAWALEHCYPEPAAWDETAPLRVAIWVPWLPSNPNGNILRVVAGYLGGLLERHGVEAALVITNEVSYGQSSAVPGARTDPSPYRAVFEGVIGEYGAPPESLHIAPPPFVGEGNVAWFRQFQDSFRPTAIFVPNFEMSSVHIQGFGRSAATVYLQTSVRNRPPYDFIRYLYLGEKREIDASHIHPEKWHYHSFGYGNFGTGANLTRANIGLPDDAFVVVSAGNRLEEEIDPEIVSVMADAMEANPKMVWMMMGVQNPDKITQTLGTRFEPMKDRVHFKGYVREIGDYLSLSDVYANPRRTGGAVSMALAIYGQTPVLSFYGNDACNFLIGEMMEETPEAYGAKLAALARDKNHLAEVTRAQQIHFEAGHTIAASAADLEGHLRAAWAERCQG
jgi:hypothetical protein